MLSNRLIYDKCAAANEVNTNRNAYNYMTYDGKYSRSQCLMNRIPSNSGVSQFAGSIIDLESDLRGITRYASKCPCAKYNPKTNRYNNGYFKHQPSCNMFDEKPVWYRQLLGTSNCK